MLRYLSKFVLDILPPVAATVLGAWIVAHYVNPKPADPPKPEAAGKALVHGASGMAPRAVESVAVKPAETAADARPPRERPAKAAAPARAEQRPREASDLARAALDRLRHQAPADPAAAVAAALPVSPPVGPPALTAAAAAAPVLPPPVVIAPPRETPPARYGERLTPPAEVPVHSAEPATVAGERSLIGGLASAARTLVETVIPIAR